MADDRLASLQQGGLRLPCPIGIGLPRRRLAATNGPRGLFSQTAFGQAGGSSGSSGFGGGPANDPAPRPLPLVIAVRSPEFPINGVALTSSDEIFISLPRWPGAAARTPSVARLDPEGCLAPFPGNGWNYWKPGDDGRDAFVMADALHVFGDDTLWVIDRGAPDGALAQDGAQKLLQFDVASGQVLRSLRFGPGILPEGARMTALRLWGGKAYLIDAGLGAIIVHDLATGATLRRLAGSPLVKARPGKGGDVARSGQLEISPDGQWLYFCLPMGPLRRLPLALLGDAALPDMALGQTIERVAPIPHTGGTAMDTIGNLYLADGQNRRILLQTPAGQRLTLAQDERLLSPGALFIDGRRRLYIPCTQGETLPAAERPFQVLVADLPASFGGHVLGEAIAPG